MLVAPFVAQAADMPVYKGPPPVAVYSWTGCYVGGNFGYAKQRDRSHLAGTDTDGGGFGAELADRSTPAIFDSRFRGGIGGGQVGCNYQTGSFVWGIEADIDSSNSRGTQGQVNLPQPPFPARSAISTTVSNKLDWMGSVRGRLGYTLTERWMVYATGGLAYGETEQSITSSCPTCAPARLLTTTSDRRGSGTIFGWGSEYSLTNNLSLQTETAYFDLGRNTTVPLVYNYGASTSSVIATTKERGWTTRIGFNYKF